MYSASSFSRQDQDTLIQNAAKADEAIAFICGALPHWAMDPVESVTDREQNEVCSSLRFH